MIDSAHNLEGKVPDAAGHFADAVSANPNIDLRASFNTLMAKMDGLGVAAPGIEAKDELVLG